MGVSIYYQALPEHSALFKRVQTEKAFSTLFYALFPNCFNGIFYLLCMDKEELDDILDHLVEGEVFDSRAEVDRLFNQLYIELERADASYPGLVYRNVYLEKSQKVIEERLLRELKKRHINNFEYIEKFLYGNQALAPDLYGEIEDQIWLVPSSVIQDGAWMLREIKPEVLFGSTRDLDQQYYLERFEWWREFYLEAAETGEAAIVRFA